MFILFLVAITSFLAYRGTKKRDGHTLSQIHDAIRNLLEWVGTFTVLLIANLAVGVLLVLLIRTFTAQFVTLYTLENILLLVFSAAQAFVFHQWWKRNN